MEVEVGVAVAVVGFRFEGSHGLTCWTAGLESGRDDPHHHHHLDPRLPPVIKGAVDPTGRKL